MNNIELNILESTITITTKKNIQKNIEQLKNKNYYKQIFQFILSQKINYSENSNGVFFNLNLLTNAQLSILMNMIESFQTTELTKKNIESELDITYNQYITDIQK